MSDRITQIKAELCDGIVYDLIHHLSVPQNKSDRSCSKCERIWTLKDEMIRLMREKKSGGDGE